MKRHIAYWQSGAWCDDKQLPELASTDYDVLLVNEGVTDEEIHRMIEDRVNERREA